MVVNGNNKPLETVAAGATGATRMELVGISTDEKPTDTFEGAEIGVCSLFLELDTGDVYWFDGTTWRKVGAGLN